MNTADTVRTIIEFLAIAAAIIAMINEDRFIAFEDRVVDFFKEHVDSLAKSCHKWRKTFFD